MESPSPRIDFALPAELPAVAALCESCIHVAAPGYFLTRLREDPTILPEGILVIRDGARPVATVTAHQFSMRYGTAEVPVLGIANVVTEPAFRSRGYARALLDAAHQLARTRHIPMAMLSTGIPTFYEPLGYHPWERQHAQKHGFRGDREVGDAGFVRPLDLPADAGALSALQELADRAWAGPLIRSRGTWDRQRQWTVLYPREHPGLGFCAGDTGGPVRAYVRGRVDAASGWAELLECAAAPDSGRYVAALAGTFSRAAAGLGAKGLRLPAACTEFSEAFAPWSLTGTTEPDRTQMLGILNPTGLLAAVLPELTARAGAARVRLGRVAVELNGTLLRLGAVEGTVALDRPPDLPPDFPIAILNAAEWIEVLMGVRLFSAQPFASTSSVGEPEINLLDTLFPRRPSLFWESDAF